MKKSRKITDGARVVSDLQAPLESESERLELPEENSQQLAIIRGILEQEDEIRQTLPDFDLMRELELHPVLRVLLQAGEPLAKALEYVYPERQRGKMQNQAMQDVVARISKRNLRPAPLPVGRGGDASRELSDDDIARIDARLQRGERVYV